MSVRIIYTRGEKEIDTAGHSTRKRLPVTSQMLQKHKPTWQTDVMPRCCGQHGASDFAVIIQRSGEEVVASAEEFDGEWG